ncbi:MAG TPA: histidine kinase dimerization/phospho-acceptor domain-containing protein [Oligoflexia bacterium]|nr:histidine kinase dimerization/phospho-acceptor domain-containing protein [Oligoflexia bacterium]HMP48275.1 histidine kinase dimerization/phospho-acceptor domain-containing protein [Oligoflexia bacterium]
MSDRTNNQPPPSCSSNLSAGNFHKKPQQKLSDLEPDTLSKISHQLSHDIGNPLTSIISYSSILEQAVHFSLSPEKIADYAHSLSRETWRISSLVEKFLLLTSRSKNETPVSLAEVKERVLTRYISRYNLGELDLTFEGFETEEVIFAEIEHLTVILCEIASNSLGAQRALAEIKTNDDKEKNRPKIDEDIEGELWVNFKTFPINIESNQNDRSPGKYLVIEATNPSPPHGSEIEKLFYPGEKLFPSGRDNLGIGLSGILHSMSRWGGYTEIEELPIQNWQKTDQQRLSDTRVLFVTRLIFKAAQ